MRSENTVPNDVEMVDIRVYRNGKYTIKTYEYRYRYTHLMYFNDSHGSGVSYVCRKSRQKAGLRYAIRVLKKECDAEIRRISKINANLDRLSAKLDAEGK